MTVCPRFKMRLFLMKLGVLAVTRTVMETRTWVSADAASRP